MGQSHSALRRDRDFLAPMRAVSVRVGAVDVDLQGYPEETNSLLTRAALPVGGFGIRFVLRGSAAVGVSHGGHGSKCVRGAPPSGSTLLQIRTLTTSGMRRRARRIRGTNIGGLNLWFLFFHLLLVQFGLDCVEAALAPFGIDHFGY